MKILLPYGRSDFQIDLPDTGYKIDTLVPRHTQLSSHKPEILVEEALSSPVGGLNPFGTVTRNTRVAITVNDKTRPVPNALLLNPLISRLNQIGVPDTNITLFIASGTHLPMTPKEYKLILPLELITRFTVIPHDCDNYSNLYEIGTTTRGTPVSVNRNFYDHDLRIVVGDIELHHFAGYSGGVKSGAIGMCGRTTINTNHRWLMDTQSRMGEYDHNPLRQDIEEIGRKIGIHCALNAVLNENKEILAVFFGDPVQVMRKGIEVVNGLSRVEIDEKYDLVIASAGGYPKDINLYQSQKAMTHASYFCKQNGTILLIAECSEGVGSDAYLEFMKDVTTTDEVVSKFSRQGFSVGPHKAFQIARILENHKVFLYSSISHAQVSKLLIHPFNPGILSSFLQENIPDQGRIAVIPHATACIPAFVGEAK